MHDVTHNNADCARLSEQGGDGAKTTRHAWKVDNELNEIYIMKNF